MAIYPQTCRYEKILDACALRQDIAMLPGGDLTEIGEKVCRKKIFWYNHNGR